MTGKTISAYTDVETAQRIESIAVQEQRKKAQVAGMALKFFAALPDEARSAWIQLSASSPTQVSAIAQDIARVLLQAQYDLAHQQVLDEIQDQNLKPLSTEDDILAVASELTK